MKGVSCLLEIKRFGIFLAWNHEVWDIFCLKSWGLRYFLYIFDEKHLSSCSLTLHEIYHQIVFCCPPQGWWQNWTLEALEYVRSLHLKSQIRRPFEDFPPWPCWVFNVFMPIFSLKKKTSKNPPGFCTFFWWESKVHRCGNADPNSPQCLCFWPR